MTPGFDLLLPLGALAFYFYDCAHLLYGNELLLEYHLPRNWIFQATGGDRGYGGADMVKRWHW